MKVAFLNSYYFPDEIGGAEKAVRTIAESAVAAGHKAIVITLALNNISRVEDVNGVRVYYVPLANIGHIHGSKPLNKWQKLLWYMIDSYNPIMRSRVHRILKNERPDVLETNNLQGFSVSVWKAAQDLKIPVVQVLHDYYLACINSTMYTRESNCQQQCLHCKCLCAPRRKLSYIPKIVSSVSRRTFDRIRSTKMFTKNSHVYSASAINIKAAIEPRQIKEHAAEQKLTIGYLGRLDPLKGIRILLEAVKEMPAENIELFLAGTGDEEYVERLKQDFEAPNITFLGVTTPELLFEKIHLLVVPSVWEDPLPRVIAEAHANGIMVAISEIGGMPEIVEENVTGYYFQANSSKSIRDLLTGLHKLSFPSHEQKNKCLASSGAFNAESVVEHHQQVWEKVLEEKT